MCGACTDRESTCIFESLPGITRTAALKSEISQLKTNSNDLLEMYWQLKSGSSSDAWRLVEQIRSGERLVNLPPLAESSRDAAERPPSKPSKNVDALDTATSSQASKSQRPTMSPSSSRRGQSMTPYLVEDESVSGLSFAESATRDAQLDACLTAGPENMGSPRFQSFEEFVCEDATYGEDSYSTLHHSLQANLSAIQEGFEVQQACMSESFFCHDYDTFESLVAWLRHDQTIPLTSSMLCEMCAVAIVAGQYVRDSFEPGVLQLWHGRSGPQRSRVVGDS